ncbi:MAG TPA: Uma2 family endonuclease [Cryptosporangiaceae bacterium]|nr:Uma2 family endonuclease [Cryptosporangiaceae bacterium]
MASLPIEHIPVGGWTIDDLDGMPETLVRYELTDGALTVSPSPSSTHQVVAARLTTLLDDSAPDHLAGTQAVEIRFNRALTRIPDVLVVRAEAAHRHWFAPHEVLVAVEIESPGSHVEDRATKPTIYAQHLIPHYWRIELDPITAVLHEIGSDGRYQETSRSTERLTVDAPWTFDVPLADLLPRWAR